MKKSLRFVTLGGILALSIPAFLALSQNVKKVDAYSPSSLPTTIDLNDTSASNIRSYYSSLNNLSQSERQGTNLLKNLKTILKNGQKYYSYENGTSIWQMYEITDRDWDKSPASSTTYGTYDSGTNKITNYTYGTSSSSSKNNPYIHALYINRDVTNQTTAWDDHNQDEWGINREHVWPKAEGFDSSGAGGARGDPMHLMAGNGYSNNIHSNYYYGYVKTSSSYTDCGSKYSNQSGNLRGTSKTLNTGTVFEPQDCDKGDIARAIFYMVARYNYISGSDSDGIDTNNPNLTLTQNISDWSSSGYTSSTSTQGKLGILTDLLAWHHADPVDEYEIHRNNLLYTNFTNNRNPFIDFPEWADFIWGTVSYSGSTYNSYSSTPTGYAAPNSDTINGYNSGGQTISVTGVSLNKNSTSITVDGAETLEATVAPSNATNQGVSWSSSNTGVAIVSNGTVRGVAEGTATITVTTSDGGYTATCSVEVTASGGGGGGGDTVNDTMCAKGFGGYTTASYSAAGTDYTGVANLTNSSGATYAMQVFNGSTGQVRGNQSGSANFSLRNTTTYSGYYVSQVSLTVDSGGTLDGSTTDRSVVWFGSSAYANPTTAPTTGTKVAASPASSGQSTLTWSNSNTAYNYFILYDLKAASAPKSKDTDTPLVVTWSPVSSSSKTLDSIALDTSDAPTSFNVGDTFSYEGLSVTANYDDGTDDIVTPTNVSTPDMSTAGQKTVTVSYTEGGVTKTATYTITVNAVTLTSIEVVDPKTSYIRGETFVKPTVIANYSNGSTSDVTSSAEFSGYSMSITGTQTVTVSYTSQDVTKTTSYQISVSMETLQSLRIEGYKTEFNVGDTFSFGGTAYAHYSNGNETIVTNVATYSGYDMSTPGTQTVTVSWSYVSAQYQITVSDPSTDITATVVIEDYASEHSWSNGTQYTTVNVDEVVTATAAGGNNDGKYYTSGYEWRFYQSSTGTLTISVDEDYIIDSITLTYNVGNTGTFLDSGSNVVASGVSQTVNASSATYTVGNTGDATNGQAKITAITVVYHLASSVPMTSITASVSKTYTVGETISTSDISVKGDNGQIVTDFSFANNGYQFTYADAASGGTATNKTFTDAVTYSTFTCSLTVNVTRTAYQAVEDGSEQFTGAEFKSAGIGSSYATNQTATVDGITFKVDGYIYSNKLSLSQGSSSAPGKVVNTTAFSTGITNVTVSGATPDIQLSVDGSNNSWVDLANATPSTVNYYFVKIFYKNTSQSGYVNISSFTVTYKGAETATNVANYVMYEDTANQCVTKFATASNYFGNMSSSERVTFMTSSDYVIATARERFEAWARYHGKTISYENSDYIIKNGSPVSILLGNEMTNNSQILLIVIVSSLLGVSVIGGYIFLRKRKEQ